ncbi:MAG: GIY-YIG nuclease family protein [Methylotenera sp.]
MIAGIYQIISKSSRNCYIGSTINTEKRLREHQNAMKRGDHHSHILQRAFNKVGLDGFEFKTLIICAAKDLLLYEQNAINVFNPKYNISRNAGSVAGTKRSAEVIQRLKDSWKKRGMSEAQKRHLTEMSIGNIGRKKEISIEQRAKISATLIGRKQSVETKLKKSLATKGIKKTEEHKRKISESRLGKKRLPFSDEWKRNISLAMKARYAKKEIN